MDWRPYLPDISEEIWVLATGVAVGEKLFPESLHLGDDLIQHLEEARRVNKVVAILVDTWSLELDHYHRFMRAFDDRGFWNCAVLVPWNTKDSETVTNRARLEDRLRFTFQNRATLKDPGYFTDTISTADELKTSLANALSAARARIISNAEVSKKLKGAPGFPAPGV